MRFDLAALAKSRRPIRRKSATFRDIVPPAMLATDLYQSAYAPILAAWERHLPTINAAYARALSELVTDDVADVRGALDGADNELLRLVLRLAPELEEWALKVERWQRGKWVGAALSATGVDLSTMLGPEDVRATLETAIEWNVSLVKDVSDQVRQRIGNAVFSGLRNRTPAREVARTISEATGMGRDRARRLAADQLSKITSSLADERRRQAGIDEWMWIHSAKLHPRREHVERDGNIYNDKSAPNDRPGQLPYCGCRSRAHITFD